jgi:hypothetical protein
MLAAVTVAGAALAVPAGAQAATTHHHHVRTCPVSDWGATAEHGGRWYICQPAGHGFTWQALPGRQMAS